MKANYSLSVRDFGPISSAAIEVRPLTVFVGPSNTGKSYLAVLLYVLHQAAFAELPPIPGHLREESVLAEPMLESLATWLSEAEQGGQLPRFPPDVVTRTANALLAPGSFLEELANTLKRCYGIESLDKLVCRYVSDPRTTIRLVMQSEAATAFGYEFCVHQGDLACSGGSIPDINEIVSANSGLSERIHAVIGFVSGFYSTYTQLRGDERPDRDSEPAKQRNQVLEPKRADAARSLFVQLLDETLDWILTPLQRRALYLPADRTGLLRLREILLSSVWQQFTVKGTSERRSHPVISGVLADFLATMSRLGGRTPDANETIGDLADQLEKHILGGDIQVKRESFDNMSVSYRPSGWNNGLPIERTSSMVSELAPLVLYMRNVLRSGDMLIIEEPESHLHPAAQTGLARLLVRLVNAGVRVVLTTHSEWLLEQIGNLAALSELPEEERRGIECADAAISPDLIGVWLFSREPDSPQATVSEVSADPDTGLYSADFDMVSEALYNDNATIFNRRPENRP